MALCDSRFFLMGWSLRGGFGNSVTPWSRAYCTELQLEGAPNISFASRFLICGCIWFGKGSLSTERTKETGVAIGFWLNRLEVAEKADILNSQTGPSDGRERQQAVRRREQLFLARVATARPCSARAPSHGDWYFGFEEASQFSIDVLLKLVSEGCFRA